MIPFIAIMLAFSFVALLLAAAINEKYSRHVAVAASLLMLLTVLVMLAMSLLAGSAAFSESYAYIAALNVSLGFRVGAVSLILLLMSSAVLLAASLSGNPENKSPKTASVLTLLLQVSAIGLFSSANLFLFLIFWDIGVVAMFVMISVLGSAGRSHAAMRFLVYEIFASALLLVAILLAHFYTPTHSLNLLYIASVAGQIPHGIGLLMFASLFLAFMVNMPIFPMHFWLPDAYSEASTQGSMLLSGIFSKYGAFGMLLLFTTLTLPSSFLVPIAALATFSAIYAAFVMLSQHDIKRLVAYSSMAEIGIILLGIAALNSAGTAGAVMLMFAQGIISALMFLAAGSVIHIFGERDLRILKGTMIDAATTSYMFFIGTVAIVGMPLTASFVGDVLVFIGATQAFGPLGLVALAAVVLVGACLYLVIDHSLMSVKSRSKGLRTIGASQHIGYALLVAFTFIFGILPFLLLSLLK